MSKRNKTSDKGDPGVAPSQRKTGYWPPRPEKFGELLTPIEAAQYLRLDEMDNHTPQSAIRTLNYWRQKGQLKANKLAHRVWYRKTESDRFLAAKQKYEKIFDCIYARARIALIFSWNTGDGIIIDKEWARESEERDKVW